MKRSKFDLLVFMLPKFFPEMIKVPDIQRDKDAWNLEQKQTLIDSLYNDFDIPKIYFRSIAGQSGIWWLIDGQQRITTIHEFLNNRFPLGQGPTLPEALRGKYFQELEESEAERIRQRSLDCIIVECTEEEEEDMFVRLNNGTPLNQAEKRNAVKGEFRDSIRKLAGHPFFLNGKFQFQAKRFAVDVLCAQFTSLVLHQSPAITSRALDSLYERYRHYPDREKYEGQVVEILDWLDYIFPEKKRYLRKSTIFTYFLVLKELKAEGHLEKLKQKDLLRFFEQFEAEKETNNNRNPAATDFDRELVDYQILLNKGAYHNEALRKRSEILKRRFRDYFSLPQA